MKTALIFVMENCM